MSCLEFLPNCECSNNLMTCSITFVISSHFSPHSGQSLPRVYILLPYTYRKRKDSYFSQHCLNFQLVKYSHLSVECSFSLLLPYVFQQIIFLIALNGLCNESVFCSLRIFCCNYAAKEIVRNQEYNRLSNHINLLNPWLTKGIQFSSIEFNQCLLIFSFMPGNSPYSENKNIHRCQIPAHLENVI